jgi:predicted phosphodiesterase
MPALQTYDEARAVLLTALGETPHDVAIPTLPTTKTERVIVMSDFHAPFVNTKLFTNVLRTEPAQRAILLGDLDDGYAISRFIKYKAVPYIQSLAFAKALVVSTAETYPRVDIIEGNHDAGRFEKYLRTRLDTDVIEAIRLLAGGDLSPLRALTRDIPNVHLVGHVVEDESLRWLYQYHDVLFVHAEKFSVVPGSAMRRLYDWLTGMQRHLGLKPFRAIIQAHTHQLSWFPYSDRFLLAECGCMASLQGYQLDARASGLPQRNGYLTMEFEHGKVILDSIRPHWADE